MTRLADSAFSLLKKLGFGQRRCCHCLAPFTAGKTKELLCPECRHLVAQYAGEKCRLCGNPGLNESGASAKNICAACAKDAPAWQNFAYYGLYDGLLRDMLLRLKFDGELQLARLCGELLLDCAACLAKPDIICAIPQHPDHLRKRGFNQAHEIARAFCLASGHTLCPQALRRIRPGLPQERLDARQRAQNLAGAFRASPMVAQKHVWLVDDIMTTGATGRAASKALLAAGAAAVSLLFVARTPLI